MAKPTLTRSQVEHIAKLASLVLTEEEINRFQQQLSQILDYVNKLQEVDVEKVAPTSQVTGLQQVLREDTTEPGRTLSQEAALKSARKAHKGLFVARKVLG